MRHIFAYKRLKIMENYKTVRVKSGCSCSREGFIYERFMAFLLGKAGCFVYCVLIGGGL